MAKTVNVKFMALNENGEVAAGVVMNCPSIEALREKLEGMGAVIVHADIATEQEIADAKEASEED